MSDYLAPIAGLFLVLAWICVVAMVLPHRNEPIDRHNWLAKIFN